MSTKEWNVSEDMHFEEFQLGVLLFSKPDQTWTFIGVEEIDGMIDALKHIKVHFETQELPEVKQNKLPAIWGDPPNVADIMENGQRESYLAATAGATDEDTISIRNILITCFDIIF